MLLQANARDRQPQADGNATFSTHLHAHRALTITAALAIFGSSLGALAALQGQIAGAEIALVASCGLFSTGSLIALLAWRKLSLQAFATTSTLYYALYLAAGLLFAATSAGNQFHLLCYLIWYFPLLAFNKLVNAPVMGRALTKVLRILPVFLVIALTVRLTEVLKANELIMVITWCVCYSAYGTVLEIVSRYREDYLVERERADASKSESELLESISDYFVSMDAGLRLEYLNGAACSELGIQREVAVGETFARAAPEFLSQQIAAGLAAAAATPTATTFEAPNARGDAWYRLRCFPRAGGMSIFFRNISERMTARRKLDEAQDRLREQAALLDYARDAIFVQDAGGRISYWNKGAERLYGWAPHEVLNQRVADVFGEGAWGGRNDGVDALRDGEWSGELRQRRRDGTWVVVESRAALVTGSDAHVRSVLVISTDISNRKAAEQRIEQLAYFDTLTGLPNRYLFRERLAAVLDASSHDGTSGALLLVDLDDFRTPNDTLGHAVGDQLLREVARRISTCAGAGDTVARLGGDEFVITLAGLSPILENAVTETKACAERIQRALLVPCHLGSYEYRGSASVGIAVFDGAGKSVDEVLSRADLALHRAKAQGRNALSVYDPSMLAEVAARASLQADLRVALQNHEFELHYQPVVDARGVTLGAEALVRWRHPVRGLVPPAEFIPLAEEAGLIAELGQWVLETACSQLATWAQHPAMCGLTVAVNVSLREMLNSNFTNVVLDVLRRSGADPLMLRLEITESSAMTNPEDTIAKMTALKDKNVRFSMDDFGTEYSSLARLKRLPLDILKVDRSFVKDILSDDKAASIARAIVALGRNLHLRVIAEGVETEEQREFLEAEGCDGYQGFLFSPAISAAAFEAFVELTGRAAA